MMVFLNACAHPIAVASRSAVRLTLILVVCALSWGAGTDAAYAHGFAGKRFFPATLATEDPFVADEFSLPTISRSKSPASGDEPATTETSYSTEFAKRITPNLGIGLEATYLRLRPDGADTQNGFDNLGASLKYQFFKNDEHETILSAGVDWDIGGSGAKRVRAESFSTVTPTLFFGKGLGDLPDSIKYLRPLAVTGLAGIAIPTRSGTSTLNDDGELATERHPHLLKWGFAVEYSLPYLQSFIKDVGLREPFNRLIPLVEFSFATPLDRGGSVTTGTINPGILWAGRTIQLGIEAVVPVNSRSGRGIGIMGQLHFYLDDLFPRSIGRPLFGK